MIAKGTTHNNGAKLAQYMTTGKDGERAELWQLHGFGSNDIKEAFRSIHVMAEATKCEQPFFHVQVRNRDGETLTRQQWETTAHRIMRINGLTGQPYAIAFHTDELTGDAHMHLAVSLIDEDNFKAKRLPFFKGRLKVISRELEQEFGLEPVKNEREGPIKYAPTRAQDEQARRLGVDLHAVRNTIRTCWDHSDNGRSFEAALAEEGLILAQGDRRGLVVIDHEGGIHALGKRILDVTPGQMNARMSDLPREELPGVAEVKAFVTELKAEPQREKPAPVWDRESATVRDEIHWQEALDKAAIAKEKTERQFVEPKGNENDKPAAERNQTQPGGREERVWPVHPPQHQSWPGFERAATEATRDDRAENLKGPAGKVWQIWTHIAYDEHAKCIRELNNGIPFSIATDPKAFAAGLDARGIMFAVASKEEAERSHREADFARAIGNHAPRFKEGEIVIVTEPRPEYRRKGEIIEPSRVHKLDQSLAEKFVAAIDNRGELQGIDATLKASDQRAQQRRADREAFRLEKATTTKDFSREIPRDLTEGVRKTIRIADNLFGGIGAGVHAVADALDSLLSVKLTPEQIREGEINQQRREDEAEASIDYSRYTAEFAQQRRQQENERAGEGQRQRDRERGGRDL
jgi:MobA/VirD2-like, nuclease domain